LLQGLVFVYCTEDDARAYVKDTPAICFVRFYYNRTVTYADGTNPPLEVDYNAMMNFIRVTSIDDDNIMRLDEEFIKYESNDLVEVIDGKFQGVKGRVARAAGQQRVIVELEGVALVATAYIPTAFLRRLSQA
jgi:transcription antitermination factor NusG